MFSKLVTLNEAAATVADERATVQHYNHSSVARHAATVRQNSTLGDAVKLFAARRELVLAWLGS